MPNNSDLEHALDSALASVRLEGFPVTEQTRKDCLRLLKGEVSVEELVREIRAQASEKAEKPAKTEAGLPREDGL